MQVSDVSNTELTHLVANLDDDSSAVICFWNPGCEECIAFMPIYESVADSSQGIVFVRVNVESEQEAVAEYDIDQVPTLFALRGCILENAHKGAVSVEELQSFVKQAFGTASNFGRD